MFHTQEAAQVHQIAGPQGGENHAATADHGRRWYHLRPEPRRRTDLMGVNSTWWSMAVGWLIIVLLVLFPFPWWW